MCQSAKHITAIFSVLSILSCLTSGILKLTFFKDSLISFKSSSFSLISLKSPLTSLLSFLFLSCNLYICLSNALSDTFSFPSKTTPSPYPTSTEPQPTANSYSFLFPLTSSIQGSCSKSIVTPL